ncbi:MAG: glutamate--tRNA ligase [bacterium]|nr:glutamate--tRNA ligase [bacterium]
MVNKEKSKEIRVRMAPSPTGNLHIGTVRTTLFNWLFARHHQATFIMRIEDTDRDRSKPEFEQNILEGLEWLGLSWDEFYRQSERVEIHKKYLTRLLEEKKAFWCYHTVEELEVEKEEQMKNKEAPRHICDHKYTIPEGRERQIIRLAVDEKADRAISFNDLIRGPIEFEGRTIGDLSLAKDEDTPLYNFAVVVDDVEMRISHVIRGEDHINNTPKQILIAEALGAVAPQFAHLPLILGSDRSKLSKRHGATMFDEYIQAGYLPAALINFLALLGWTPEGDQEVLSVEEIISKFELEKVHKSGAIFDNKKLNWISVQHLKKLSDEELAEKLMPFIEKHFGTQDKNLILKVVPSARERLEYLDQIKEFHYFFKKPEYDSELLVWKKSDKTGAKKALEEVQKILTDLGDEWGEATLKAELDKLAQEQFGGDRGAVYWPLRVALTGEKFSPDPISIVSVLTKEEVLNRISKAIR